MGPFLSNQTNNGYCGIKDLLDWLSSVEERKKLVPAPIARMYASWKALAGDHLQTLLTSREEAVKGLSSQSAHIRNVCFQVLLKQWKPNADIASQCKHAIRHDPDLEVRVRAIYYFSAIYKELAHLEASRFLAETIMAPDTTPRIREAAFLGLLRIHGRPLPRELILNVKQDHPEKTYPIDHEFVKRFS